MKIKRTYLALIACFFLLFSLTLNGCRKNVVQKPPVDNSVIEEPVNNNVTEPEEKPIVEKPSTSLPSELYPKEQRQVAPDFTLPKLDGSGDLSLASLKGKYVLIDFTTTWCIWCTKQEPQVVDLFNKYEKKGFTVIAIDCNEPRDTVLTKYPGGKNIYPVILDENSFVSRNQYGVEGYPFYLLLDKDGKVAYVQNGFKENMFQTVSDILDYMMENES